MRGYPLSSMAPYHLSWLQELTEYASPGNLTWDELLERTGLSVRRTDARCSVLEAGPTLLRFRGESPQHALARRQSLLIGTCVDMRIYQFPFLST